MHATTIIGYIYRADIYCTRCIIEQLPTGDGEAFDGWALADDIAMSTEDNLNEIAAAFGIDRWDETSFDSDEFPKVIFASMADGDEFCGSCGELLIED